MDPKTLAGFVGRIFNMIVWQGRWLAFGKPRPDCAEWNASDGYRYDNRGGLYEKLLRGSSAQGQHHLTQLGHEQRGDAACHEAALATRERCSADNNSGDARKQVVVTRRR